MPKQRESMEQMQKTKSNISQPNDSWVEVQGIPPFTVICFFVAVLLDLLG
jgi:hypothetical protein